MLETLFTVAIFVILLGLTMVGVARWRDFLKITELDNAARAIYMAAENRAVLLQNSGAAASLLSSAAAPPASGDLTFSEISVPLTDGTTRDVSLRVLSSDTTRADILNNLLPAGVIDPALWDGYFYVLYDKDTCHVFEVFYAEELFAEGELGTLRDMSRSQRVSHYREDTAKRCLVGHYDGGLADKIDTNRLPAPGVEVLIENGNELTLTVKYTIPPEPAGVEVKREPNVTLECGGEKVQLLYVDEFTKIVTSPYNTRLTTSDDIASVTKPTSVTYTWVLDSLAKGPGDSSRQFKDLFGASVPILGGNFTVTADLKLSADGYIGSSYYDQDTENSLFATASGDTGTAYIDNLRHLQNLDAVSSGAAAKTAAVQRADIDADTLRNNKGEEISTGYEFKPIQNWDLRSYKALSAELEGEAVPYSIESLHVTEDSAAGKVGAGLFSIATDFKFQNILIVDSAITGTQDTGALVGHRWSAATFENCRVIRTQVTSTANSAGGLSGYSSVDTTFTDCTVENAAVTGASFAGGLIGNPTAGDFSFERCRVAGSEVTGVNIAGGMAGYNWGGKVSFEDCEAENLTVRSTGSAAGGLMGSKGGGSIRFTGCKVGQDSETGITITGTSPAGGLVGYTFSGCTSTFARCTVGGSGSAGKITIKGTFAGGLAGSESGGATFDDCHVVSAEVNGSDTAGGLAGGVGSTGDMTYAQFTGCTTGDVTVAAGNYAGGLVGNSATKDSFADCRTVNASVTGSGDTSIAGGLVGGATNAEFQRCATERVIVKSIMDAGGLVGEAIDVSLAACTTTNASVDAENYAGGLTGNSTNGAFSNCEAVNAGVACSGSASEAGGLVGRSKGTNLLGCQVYWNDASGLKKDGVLQYQVRAVTAGGLVGAVRNGGIIQNSFAATLVQGKTYAGGLVGHFAGSENGGNFYTVVMMSYADCYLQDGQDGGTPYAGGLIGMKALGVTLELENVYAVGFIDMVGNGNKTAAGLCGGWASGTTAKNAYAAMHYAGAGTIQPLAYNVQQSDGTSCYFLEDDMNTDGKTYEEMTAPAFLNAMGGAFMAPAETHPYNLDGPRGTYPFPGLAGLPHYGDWLSE